MDKVKPISQITNINKVNEIVNEKVKKIQEELKELEDKYGTASILAVTNSKQKDSPFSIAKHGEVVELAFLFTMIQAYFTTIFNDLFKD